jgi:hypothetical protein
MAIVNLYKKVFYSGSPDEGAEPIGVLYCADFPKAEKSGNGCTNIKTSEWDIFREAVHKAKSKGFIPKGLPRHVQDIEIFPKPKSIEGIASPVRTIINTSIKMKR